MRAWLLATLIAAGWFGLQAMEVQALERPRLRLPAQDLSESGRPRGVIVTPSDAARIAQQQNGGGKVLAVEPDATGYRVKLLKNGDVRIVYVPGT